MDESQKVKVTFNNPQWSHPHTSEPFFLHGETEINCHSWADFRTLRIATRNRTFIFYGRNAADLRALSDAISRAVDCLDAAPGADERAARGFGAFEDIARASYKGSGDVT